MKNLLTVALMSFLTTSSYANIKIESVTLTDGTDLKVNSNLTTEFGKTGQIEVIQVDNNQIIFNDEIQSFNIQNNQSLDITKVEQILIHQNSRTLLSGGDSSGGG